MCGKKLLYGLGASFGMLILILDGKSALTGAVEGIRLCLQSVIPSLFPFIFLSILLTNAFLGSKLPFLSPLGKLCGIPEGTESILITGLLGGYPVGAQTVSTAYQAGQISRRDAQRMLYFCSNAGPAFLFGICGSLFRDGWTAWILWAIHMLSALMVGILIPGCDTGPVCLSPTSKKMTPSEALNSAVRIIAAICGWIVLFRILVAFLDRWILWLLPEAGKTLVIGILELANGCVSLSGIPDDQLRFLLCSGMLAFGGLCIVMQTASVIGDLPLRPYLIGKLMQTVFSLVFAVVYLQNLAVPVLIFTIFVMLILHNRQKRSSNSVKAVV